MPMICVCVEMVLGNASLAAKARKVAAAGFRALEFWSHDAGGDRKLDDLAAACGETGLAVNDLVADGPGISLVSAADREKYLARLRQSIAVAKKLDCGKLITCTGNRLPDRSDAEQHDAIVETLRAAAAVASQAGVVLVLEPLNSLVDHRGYYLDSGHQAAQIVEQVASPALRLLWDLYHMQIMHGNVLATIERYLPLIGHFHAAGVPGRHELDVGELNYVEILSRIKAWGYDGMFGLEYAPATTDHAASLADMRNLTAAAGWE